MANFNLIYTFIIIISVFPFECCHFKFSVIIAIYNTGKYLNDSIGSLLEQSCSFNIIQIILINDGSLDNSHEVCLKYKKKYPHNIIYKNIEHGGISKARNIGLEYVKGEYINFLDPDDLWDSKAFEYVLNFYKQHKSIDLVAGRIKYFEGKAGYHLLDFKFTKTRVVNLFKEYRYIQLSASSCFIRSKIIKNLKFIEEIKFAEDVRYINTLLLYKPKIGYIREALYNYRIRKDGSSAIQNSYKDKSFYFTTLYKVHYFLINLSISLYNEIVPFIQYFLLYDIQFRIKANIQKYFNTFNISRYREMIDKILNCLNEKFILSHKFIPNKLKLLILSRKYGTDLRNDLVFENNSIKYEGKKMIDFYYDKNIIYWTILDIKNDILHLEGKDSCWMERDKYFYYAVIGNEKYYPEYKDDIHYNLNTIYGIIIKGRIILFDIPIKNVEKQVLHIFISYLKHVIEIFPSFNLLPIIPPLTNGYCVSGNFILKKEERNLIIYNYTQEKEILFESKYIEELKLYKKEYLIELRKHKKIYRLKSKKKKKEIWLINDKLNIAGDNGEFFFRYINKNKKDVIDSYFIISENSTDYERLKNIGIVIPYNSKEHLFKYLIADKIISSFWDPNIYNPFGKDRIYLNDMFQFDYIYLQHTIYKNELSFNFQKINKNLKMIITASKKEYKNLISSNYGYNEDNIKLTGFSLYDNLQKIKIDKKPEKLILIFPSWRDNINGLFNYFFYNNIYSPFFKSSQYFEFYNKLINSKKLLKIMNKFNYKGYFYLHPLFSSQSIDFTKNPVFIIKNNFNITELLSKSSLLVTDYSNIFFDFAYMEKPIIYTQFDFKEYTKNKNRNNDFDYNKDGFGPVYNNIDKSVKGIIESIENGCPLKRKYLRRIKKYFTFFDDKNNARIYNNIFGISEKKYLFYKIDKHINCLILIFILLCKRLNPINAIY